MKMTGYAYIASHGETFDSIAFAVYGNEAHAVELLQANPKLDDLMVFKGGEMVLLPEIVNEDKGDYVPQVAPWRV